MLNLHQDKEYNIVLTLHRCVLYGYIPKEWETLGR